MNKATLAKMIAQQLGVKDARLLDLIGRLAEVKAKVCEFVECSDTLYLCIQLGDSDHVRVKVEGFDAALRNARMAPRSVSSA